jgi:hypothetical protein
MTLANRIAEALKTGSAAEVILYWDAQDYAGPAFRTKDDSGPLSFCGWAHVSGRKVEDAEVAGYDERSYFARDRAYRGPDQHGIYPVLS